jgi:ribosomal protein S18 acetylase RimI-like enzyme
MIETFLIEHPFVAIGIWAVIYCSDYYLTLWGATLYNQSAQAFIELGGSYELEQPFRKDIDALRRISPQFLLRLLISTAGLLLLWWLSVRVGEYPEFFLVGFGAYALTEVVIHIRHIRNIVFFRALGVPGAAQGHIKYARWVTERISTLDLLSFAAFFSLCYVLSGRWLFVGGLLGCLSVTRRHAIRARKERHAIRRATLDDAAAVGRIHVESWNVAYRGIMPDDVIARTDLAYRTEFWKERIGDPDWPVFLIEEHGEAVAFCQMIPSRDEDDDATRVGHITSLHVLPHLRGQGHGRALVDRVIAEFKRRRFREVTLWVLEGNKPARRFYERYGFRRDRGTRTYPKTDVPEVRYRIRVK